MEGGPEFSSWKLAGVIIGHQFGYGDNRYLPYQGELWLRRMGS
jgi:hypothetical protein